MGIVNIVDGRNNKYRFLKINAIVEAAWHDNACEDADKVEDRSGPDYDQMEHTSLEDAVKWGSSFSSPVTLYLYDHDVGIYIIERTSIEEV